MGGFKSLGAKLKLTKSSGTNTAIYPTAYWLRRTRSTVERRLCHVGKKSRSSDLKITSPLTSSLYAFFDLRSTVERRSKRQTCAAGWVPLVGTTQPYTRFTTKPKYNIINSHARARREVNPTRCSRPSSSLAQNELKIKLPV